MQFIIKKLKKGKGSTKYFQLIIWAQKIYTYKNTTFPDSGNFTLKLRFSLYPPEASGGYFGLAFALNALRGKQQQLGSPNLQDVFIGG